jgi:malate synthase
MADVRVVGPPVERAEEVARIGGLPHLDDARRLFEQVALAEDFPDFLTLPAYDLID